MSKYANNKPKECTLCKYYNDNTKKCGLEACYYLLEAPKKETSCCDGCPYGKGHEFCFPCWQKILGHTKSVDLCNARAGMAM